MHSSSSTTTSDSGTFGSGPCSASTHGPTTSMYYRVFLSPSWWCATSAAFFVDDRSGLGLAPAQHLLEALTGEPESLRGPGLRPALPQRVLDHPALERFDGVVERTQRGHGAR